MSKKQILVLLLAFSSIANAADKERYHLPVLVTAECDKDTVGQRLVFKVREEIRRSSSMRLADTRLESIVQSSIICLAPDEDEREAITHYSLVITITNFNGTYDYLLNHGTGRCGSKMLDSCAGTIVASLDSAIVEARAQTASGRDK